ncbi:MAG TPA: transketolase [Gemmatimonadaceae bacterium]|nr:transketolase [Gemmatimonadaceae bacterium]
MSDRDELCINTIRMLAVDTVQKAESGHPGMPMGAATLAYVLWTRHLRHSPAHPSWPERDRFVLSAGHGSALLYSLLHLTGYDLTLDDLQHFRQWESRTPGHPERGCAPGVEVSTGPLGQGLGNALGLAMAERWLAATFNRPGHEVIDHRTYVLASDGDMMEGISSEVASLAATLRLGRLIVLYDANQVTLSATTDITFTEDVGGRFESCGWHVQRIDGMNVEAVDAALRSSQADDRPSLIVARTHLGYGSPKKQDTFGAHGEPLGTDEVRATKRALGWPEEPPFHVPEEALHVFRAAGARGADLEADWTRRVNAHRHAEPVAGETFAQALSGELPRGWKDRLPVFTPADGDMATRDAGGKVLNALAAVVTNLVGGSADLDPSTKTALAGLGDFESPHRAAAGDGAPKTQGLAGGVWGYAGRNIHFGVREHAMAAAVTGMAIHGGVVPYASTFLTFSDYMRPSIRLAALSRAHVIYVWTHDSLALGEDGPTHQPIEHLASLRAIPGMLLLRPSDATETVEAWRVALLHREGPVGIVLTRQKLPILDRTKLAPADGLAKGAYVLIENGAPPQAIIIATGSEVSIALAAHETLARDGIACRVIAMPSWELFDQQPQAYRDALLPPGVRARVSIEAASPFGWERYVGRDGVVIGVDRFGASAPGPVVMREYGFTAGHVVAEVKRLLASPA